MREPLKYQLGYGPSCPRWDRVVMRASLMWKMNCYEAQRVMLTTNYRPGHVEIV